MRPRSTGSLIGAAVCALVLTVGARRVEARPAHFLGPHPIAAKMGGGYCYIDGPHIHAYMPDHAVLYHDIGGELVFVGDPSPFGYEGPRFTFYGHHPVPGVPGAVYCYIDGPHAHPYAPPEAPEYRTRDNVAFYVGPYDPIYYKERPQRAKHLQVLYRPWVSTRPTVNVTPPPEWHGEVWVAPPTVEVNAPGLAAPSATVEVRAPGVYVGPPPPVQVVAPPPPRVNVEVRGPGIYVPPPPRVQVVAPPPPHVQVRVGAPPPVFYAPRPVVVAPSPVYVGPPPPGRVEVRYEDHHGGKWKHDNGKHKGWDKHGGWDDNRHGGRHGH